MGKTIAQSIPQFHHHFLLAVKTIPNWVVYDIVLPTLYTPFRWYGYHSPVMACFWNNNHPQISPFL